MKLGRSCTIGMRNSSEMEIWKTNRNAGNEEFIKSNKTSANRLQQSRLSEIKSNQALRWVLWTVQQERKKEKAAFKLSGTPPNNLAMQIWGRKQRLGAQESRGWSDSRGGHSPIQTWPENIVTSVWIKLSKGQSQERTELKATLLEL